MIFEFFFVFFYTKIKYKKIIFLYFFLFTSRKSKDNFEIIFKALGQF